MAESGGLKQRLSSLKAPATSTLQQGVKKETRFHKRESEAEGGELTRVSEASSPTEGSAERPSGSALKTCFFLRALRDWRNQLAAESVSSLT